MFKVEAQFEEFYLLYFPSIALQTVDLVLDNCFDKRDFKL
jgi:hypothetical protein